MSKWMSRNEYQVSITSSCINKLCIWTLRDRQVVENVLYVLLFSSILMLTLIQCLSALSVKREANPITSAELSHLLALQRVSSSLLLNVPQLLMQHAHTHKTACVVLLVHRVGRFHARSTQSVSETLTPLGLKTSAWEGLNEDRMI